MVEDNRKRGTIFDPSGSIPPPEKRKHVWVQNPNVFEIGGCPKCHGQNITWSEYDDYCWCYDCEIDYIPESFGIFEGPIPAALTEMMGIRLERMNLETGKIYKYGDPEFDTTWP